MIQLYMYIVALIGSLLFYLQAYKIFKTKSVKDVSTLGFVISLFTSINWLIYGIVKQDNVLIFSGSLCTIGVLIIIFQILKYRK